MNSMITMANMDGHMQLPAGATEFKKYHNFQNEDQLLEHLRNHPSELVSFFLVACEDETWIEAHPTFLRGVLDWLTDASINRDFPQEFFHSVVVPIQQHIQVLKPFIPLDLQLKNGQINYPINSFLLGQQSEYFRRRIQHECRGQKERELKVENLSSKYFPLIDEWINTGEVINLWKLQPQDLWSLIDEATSHGFPTLVEECEKVLRRYIDRNNVFDMLMQAHQKSLQLLQNASIEFINSQEMGIRLLITPVEDLAVEFLDYKERAMEAFDKVKSSITHLVFSRQLTVDPLFKQVVNQCSRLIGLDLSDSTAASEYLGDLPEWIKVLRLTHCRWLTPAMLQTLSSACPKLTKLDLSSNDQLTYAIWAELQRFKKIISLDVSRCVQIGDQELRMILQACPHLAELKLMDCHKISSEGFFEIAKWLPGVALLNISRTAIADAAFIDIMTRCRNLYFLDISRCDGLSDKAIFEGIRNCLTLKTIHLRHTRLTKGDIERLKGLHPYLTIFE